MEENKLALVEEKKEMSIFATVESFELAQRMASALAKSTVIPKDFQNNISNTLIAIDMSKRMNMPPMMVMQNLVIIHGKPSWSSTFVIAAINASARYKTPIQFKLEGTGNNMSCIAYVTTWDDVVLEGPKITMEMADKEGWLNKAGSKWKTMPEVMIRYRSASFFGRLYCSDILMGVYSEDETNDMQKEKQKSAVPNTFVIEKEEPPVVETVIDIVSEEVTEQKQEVFTPPIDVKFEPIEDDDFEIPESLK
jgi:hypothetical protein